MVEHGMAVQQPIGAPHPCWRELQVLEGRARANKAGIWRNQIIVDSGNLAALEQARNSFQIVSGRIRSIGERERWIYLNFSADWQSDFTVMVPRKFWSILLTRFTAKSRLVGHRVLVRGIVKQRNGPVIYVDQPGAITLIN